jgi:hypothetical protein
MCSGSSVSRVSSAEIRLDICGLEYLYFCVHFPMPLSEPIRCNAEVVVELLLEYIAEPPLVGRACRADIRYKMSSLER